MCRNLVRPGLISLLSVQLIQYLLYGISPLSLILCDGILCGLLTCYYFVHKSSLVNYKICLDNGERL